MWGRSSKVTERLAGLRIVIGSLIAALGCGSPNGDELVLAVASSQRGVMPELIAEFTRSHPGAAPVVTYGGSGTLRRQVEAGAPVDAVVFAGATHVDALIAAGLADADSRRVLARNELVLVGAGDGGELDFASLAELPAGENLAIGEPDTVPAGEYARALLQALGVWGALEDRLVYAAHVAAVLAYVERGEVAAGVVYRTDATMSGRVRILDRPPPGVGPSPEVVAAVTITGQAAGSARSFLDYLGGDASRSIFARHGFLTP
jgi:molybdate transport system substrate-binding protein